MRNSEEAVLGSGCGGPLGWSLGVSSGYFLERIPGLNKRFKYRTLVGLVIGGIYVEYMVSSEGVRDGEVLVMIYSKRWGRWVKE